MNESTLNRMIREHKARIIWFLVFLILAVFVTALVFGTLKRSVQAQTYTKRVFACSYAQEGAEPVAHQHNDDCYENGELICTLPERELHIHGDECYAEEKVLVCTLEEGEGHVHTDACYTEEPVLVCGLEENNGHVHSVEAGCYTRVQGDLICTNEDPEHVHTDDCYTWEEVLTCEIPEGEGAHHHSEECYETQRVLSCGKEEGEGAHTHDDTCYEIQKVLICDKEEVKTEHVHTVDCFKVVDMSPEEIHALHMSELPESDPTADVESPDVWESRFASVPLSGEWDRDLLKIAETQLGYTESQRNFDAVLDENGEGYTLKGWTRYGAWYGIPYGDWCAMFISFCLNYADIPESAIPYDCATTTWIDSLSERGMYAPAGSYDPKPGDLIFFDWEGDGLSDHVGIVWAVNAGSITTIEGNHTPSVELFDYDLSDGHIQGYGILPENPALAVTNSVENSEGNEHGENENQDVAEGEAASAAGTSDSADTINNSEDTDNAALDPETLAQMPPFSYTERVAGMRVTIEADAGAFPEGTTVKIKPIEDDGLAEQVAPAISGQVVKVQAVDITFYDADGNEIEPRIPIRVTMRPFTETEADNVGVVHVGNDGVVSAVDTQNDVAQPDQGIAFSADSFSTYALVYTVTFAYDGEGNVYQYSMPGGTGLSLRELLIDLGMKTEANVDSYLSHVVNVAFSKPDCMTLTKEGNDWRLQSVHAFDTPESLTVTFDDYSMLAIPVSVSGIEELQLENASISSADGVFLPEGTEGYANVVEDTAETISVVEDYVEKNTPEPTLLQQLFSFGSKADENKDGSDKAYQVFDIGLDNIDTDSFKDGFNVEVKLPENIIGKDFHLYHIHDGNVEEIDLTLDSTKVETGSDLVTGFSFQTDSFSTFTLSYTVDFHYHGAVYSIPGNTQILLTQLIEIMHITVPDNDKAPENTENLDNAKAPDNAENLDSDKAPENAENLDNAKTPENDENLDSDKASENKALLDVHDVASVEFTDTHLVQVDQVSGLLTINGAEADGELIDVDAGDYNFLLSSLEPFSTEELLTITLKDGTVIEVDVTDAKGHKVIVNLYDEDGVTPSTDFSTLEQYRYIIVERLYANDDKNTPIGYLYSDKFTAGQLKDHEIPFSGKFTGLSSWGGDQGTVDYNEEKHTISVRLYQVDMYNSTPWGYGFFGSAKDTVDGYTFKKDNGNVTVGDTTTLNLRKVYTGAYQVVVEAGEGVNLSGLTLYAEAQHASGGMDKYTHDNYSISGPGTDSMMIDNNSNIRIWSEYSNNTFSGNETTKAVIKYDRNEIANYGLLTVGDDFYQITYSKESDDDTTTDPANPHTIYTDKITINRVNVSNDYSFTDILGQGVYFGINANVFDQKDHIQSNFAVNTYYGNDKPVEADLASESGAFIAADVIDSIFIGETHSGKVLLYVNPDDAKVGIAPKQSRDFVYTVSMPKDELKASVGAILSHGASMSAELAAHEATFTPKDSGTNYIEIDTYDFPDNATIYLDGDALRGCIATTSGIKLTKKPNQMIVFNFKDSSPLTLDKFEYRYGRDDSYMVSDGKTGHGDVQNDNIDRISKHVVWNVQKATNVTIRICAGMFLIPNSESETVVSTTSSGWIITGGKLTCLNEWHSVYGELPSVTTINLNVGKTVDGKTPNGNQVFDFTVEHLNSDNDSWERVIFSSNDETTDTIQNTNGTLKAENITVLNLGWNIYRIKESPTIPSTTASTGEYTIDKRAIYAVVKCENMAAAGSSTSGSTSLIATNPVYYVEDDSGTIEFNEEAWNPNADTITDAFGTPVGSIYRLTQQSSRPVFRNNTASTDLTLEGIKTLVDANDHNKSKPLVNNQFGFELKQGDEVIQTVYNKADGSVTFQPIHYTQEDMAGATPVLDGGVQTGRREKVIIYTLHEKDGTAGVDNRNVTFEDDQTVKVKLVDDGVGNITAKIIEINGVTRDFDADNSEPELKFSMVNKYTEDKTTFSFNKIWLGSTGNINNPLDYQIWKTAIEVTIKRRAGNQEDNNFSLVYNLTIPEEGNVFSADDTNSNLPVGEGKLSSLTLTASVSGNNVFHFALPTKSLFKNNSSGIPWEYYVVETHINGYASPQYGTVETENEATTYSITLDARDAKDGGLIVNKTFGGYELPQTGGSGTALYGLLGGLMVGTAGAVLTLRKKKNKA